MSIKEIFNDEHKPISERGLKIMLYKDENSQWLRAYEISAFLAEFFNNGLKDSEKLKPTKKKLNGEEDGVICVGLPISSLSKYFPNAEIEKINDNTFSIVVKLNDYDFEVETIHDVFNEWKGHFNIAASKKKNGKQEQPSQNPIVNRCTTFSDIMREIIKYATHGKTIEEHEDFIMKLKCMCADMI